MSVRGRLEGLRPAPVWAHASRLMPRSGLLTDSSIPTAFVKAMASAMAHAERGSHLSRPSARQLVSSAAHQLVSVVPPSSVPLCADQRSLLYLSIW